MQKLASLNSPRVSNLRASLAIRGVIACSFLQPTQSILPGFGLLVVAVAWAVINLGRRVTHTWPGPPPEAADGAGRAIVEGADAPIGAGVVTGVAAGAAGEGAVVNVGVVADGVALNASTPP